MSAGPMAQAFWAAGCAGSCTWSCCFCGIATRKATSSLERLPHAQASSSRVLQTERIIDSQRELGVAEVLRSIDVVEEVVEPSASHRRPAVRKAPGQRGLRPGGKREEVLVGQLRMVLEVARQVEEGQPRAQGEGQRVRHVEVAPQGRAGAQLEEALLDGRDARQRAGGGAPAPRPRKAPFKGGTAGRGEGGAPPAAAAARPPPSWGPRSSRVASSTPA